MWKAPFFRLILTMILDKMVPYVRLVFTTLAILNSFSIVSPKDELEHSLATDCFYKGMKTNYSV